LIIAVIRVAALDRKYLLFAKVFLSYVEEFLCFVVNSIYSGFIDRFASQKTLFEAL
jgi:hypothetical protein